jgi:hypothetical protein
VLLKGVVFSKGNCVELPPRNDFVKEWPFHGGNVLLGKLPSKMVLSHKMASCGFVAECSFTYPFLGDVGFHFQIRNFHQQLSNYVNQKLWMIIS